MPIADASACCFAGAGSNSAIAPASALQHSVTVASRNMFRFSSLIRMDRQRLTPATGSGFPR
ncbi:hypothetical protein [Bradyrhizobium sp. F1.13.3]|uniref:hypothetical protein n=1 Tax=Bradyrhizobium sp. F1.13.3 TaxID=3156351 RepID=UPI0033930173